MAPLVLLPTPLPPTSFTLGQIITSPLEPQSPSFTPSSLPQPTTSLRTRHPRQKDTFLRLSAEPSTHLSLPQPKSSFNLLRRDAAAQAFFRQAALNRQPLYYVAGVQTSKSPQQQHSEPTPRVRRVDSVDSFEPLNKTGPLEESVSAVELWKVKARVGAPSAPHDLEDIDFDWTYHVLGQEGEDGQLAIGLGKALGRREVRGLLGVVDEFAESESEGSWSEEFEDGEDGIGGF